MGISKDSRDLGRPNKILGSLCNGATGVAEPVPMASPSEGDCASEADERTTLSTITELSEGASEDDDEMTGTTGAGISVKEAVVVEQAVTTTEFLESAIETESLRSVPGMGYVGIETMGRGVTALLTITVVRA